MEDKKFMNKFLNFSIGSFYFLKKNFRKIIQDIEEEGYQHTEDLERIKKEVIKIFKIPKVFVKEILKKCDFITKEDLEKFKEEIKNG
ncbi:MAG: hypothetical protein NZ891_01045 [bacterium]|nr:hypothetical protein [bacterium]MDW8163318.1 hypothetical protein [Candidatus Omnitrophota bacterium]